MSTGVTWEGEPIFYRRSRGFGLIIRDLHYLFDASGRVVRVTGVNSKVLELILKKVHKDDKQDPKMLLMAYAVTPARQKARLETKKRTNPGVKK